jgi:hypothetical protein
MILLEFSAYNFSKNSDCNVFPAAFKAISGPKNRMLFSCLIELRINSQSISLFSMRVEGLKTGSKIGIKNYEIEF